MTIWKTALNKRGLICMSLASIILSLVVGYILTQTIFFDKFVYQKSLAHGYWIPERTDLSWTDFGERGQDIHRLSQYIAQLTYSASQPNQLNQDRILGDSTDYQYTIIVIGDSYVWGQGVRNSQRFVTKLEKKLNQLFPTQAISLGNCGDNIIDNYVKYIHSKQLFPNADLYIFGIVENDLLLNQPDRYDQILTESLYSQCDGDMIYDINIETETESENTIQDYSALRRHSYEPNTLNHCIFMHLLPMLPQNNSLYMNFNGFRYDWDLNDKITSIFQQHGLFVFSPESYYRQHFHRFFIDPLSQGNDAFSVSNQDKHPSALAHRSCSPNPVPPSVHELN